MKGSQGRKILDVFEVFLGIFLRSSKRHLPKGCSWISRIPLKFSKFHQNFTRISLESLLEFYFSTGALWKGALWALPTFEKTPRKREMAQERARDNPKSSIKGLTRIDKIGGLHGRSHVVTVRWDQQSLGIMPGLYVGCCFAQPSCRQEIRGFLSCVACWNPTKTG